METTESKRVSKKRKRFNWKSVLIVVLPAVAAVAAVTVVYLTTHKASEFTLNGDGYQTYAGGTREIRSGTELKHLEDGTSVMTNGNVQEPLSDNPIYFKNRNAILMPEDVVYYDARIADPYRLDYFSEIEILDDGGVLLKRGQSEKYGPAGFLYNGKDLYLFLEPMKLMWGEYEKELDAFSFVEASPGDYLVIYDHGNNKSYVEPVTGEVIAEHITGDYSVSLLNDRMTRANGDKSLLFGRPDKLNSIYD